MNTDQLSLFAAQASSASPSLPQRRTRKPRAAPHTDAVMPMPSDAPSLTVSIALELPLDAPRTDTTPTALMTNPSLPDPARDEAQALFTPPQPDVPALRSDRLWQLDGWTARVIKNEDDDGWAVEMLQDGEAEPALVGPWTMGRDKKNPKPLDQSAFNTLVKTAGEVLQRHRQQAHAMLHKRLTVFALDAQWDVRLDITPDEYEPYATLSAFDALGEEVAQVRVPPDFRLGVASATAWITGGFARPTQATRGFEGWSE